MSIDSDQADSRYGPYFDSDKCSIVIAAHRRCFVVVHYSRCSSLRSLRRVSMKYATYYLSELYHRFEDTYSQIKTLLDVLKENSIEATEESLIQLKYQPESVWGYVEVHIEQGPVLESAGLLWKVLGKCQLCDAIGEKELDFLDQSRTKERKDDSPESSRKKHRSTNQSRSPNLKIQALKGVEAKIELMKRVRVLRGTIMRGIEPRKQTERNAS